MTEITRAFTVSAETPDETRRADRIVQTLLGSSRRRTQGLFDNRCVFVDEQPCNEPWRRLRPGETLRVSCDSEQRYAPAKKPPSYLGFDILYEDEHLIVVVKPAGWLTIPSPKRERDTLVHRVSDYLTKRNRGRRRLVYPAHRLDRGVSGVLVMATSVEIAAALRSQFEARKPERHYIAIVAGRIPDDEGTYRSHLVSDASLKQASTDDETEGELAITHFRVEQRYTDTTRVRVWLETGRRNQIRVHFAESGHPVLGDQRYNAKRADHPRWTLPRLALHATRLSFDHPVTGETLTFESAPPDAFARFARGGSQFGGKPE